MILWDSVLAELQIHFEMCFSKIMEIGDGNDFSSHQNRPLYLDSSVKVVHEVNLIILIIES